MTNDMSSWKQPRAKNANMHSSYVQYIHYVQHEKTKTGSTDQCRLSSFSIESQQI